MALMKGRAVLIKVNVGSEESPEWKAVCGQQGGALERSVETIETSDKDSENRELLGTYLTWTVSCDGLYKTEDDGFSALETAFNAKEPIMVQFAMEDFTYQGLGLISEMSFEAGHEDLVTYSCTIEGSGELTRETKQ